MKIDVSPFLDMMLENGSGIYGGTAEINKREDCHGTAVSRPFPLDAPLQDVDFGMGWERTVLSSDTCPCMCFL